MTTQTTTTTETKNLKIQATPATKNRWSLEEAMDLFALPFGELISKAQTVHKDNFNPNAIQASTLLNIKTGKCPENCSYCPQSVHYDTGLKDEPLMELEKVIKAAKKAKELGSTRFCMGAAWRSPKPKDIKLVSQMITAVKDLGLETCGTFGMLTMEQSQGLKEAGLDYYNHNIDTSKENYANIISTRTFSNRMDTIHNVQKNGIKVCAGGIIGMGETQKDRASMLVTLANLKMQPDSVPINKLIPIPGTPLATQKDVDVFEFVKVIAVARILMPQTYVRLSAGRESMSDELQFLCFFAGANSIFYGEQLLTAPNSAPNSDINLLTKLGMHLEQAAH